MSNKSSVRSILVALLANLGKETKKSSVWSPEIFRKQPIVKWLSVHIQGTMIWVWDSVKFSSTWYNFFFTVRFRNGSWNERWRRGSPEVRIQSPGKLGLMLVQDSHRSTVLFQLRDWRESLATPTATGHGLPGEFKYRFIVKEGQISPNFKVWWFIDTCFRWKPCQGSAIGSSPNSGLIQATVQVRPMAGAHHLEPPSPMYPWVNLCSYLSIFRTVFTPG